MNGIEDPSTWESLGRQFGVSFIILMVGMFLASRAGKAMWEFVKPLISAWFGKHIELTESLIVRNQKQEAADDAKLHLLKELGGTSLGKQQACDMADHACDVLRVVIDQVMGEAANGNEAREMLARLRQTVARVRSETNARQ